MKQEDERVVGEEPHALPRILVAEDNPSNFRLVEVLLRRDYAIEHAWNGREAVELVGQSPPDAVLMDIDMPEMDGYEALSRIRPLAPEVPVIALTAYAFDEDRRRIFDAGFDDMLTKPLHSDLLRRLVARYVGRKRKTQRP